MASLARCASDVAVDGRRRHLGVGYRRTHRRCTPSPPSAGGMAPRAAWSGGGTRLDCWRYAPAPVSLAALHRSGPPELAVQRGIVTITHTTLRPQLKRRTPLRVWILELFPTSVTPRAPSERDNCQSSTWPLALAQRVALRQKRGRTRLGGAWTPSAGDSTVVECFLDTPCTSRTN